MSKLTSRIHWLQGNALVTWEDIQAWIEAVCLMFDDVPIWRIGRTYSSGKSWDNHARSHRGLIFAWNQESELIELWFSISGALLDMLSFEQTKNFLFFLEDCNFKASRIDIALDDHQRRLPFPEISEAITAGNSFGYRKHRIFKNEDNCNPLYQSVLGFHFGSKTSEQTARIYDKAAESGGQINAIRLELQLRDEKAQDCFTKICQALPIEQNFSAEICSMVVTGFDFRDSNSGDRRSRCNLLPWWEAFLKYTRAEQIKIRGRNKTKLLDTTIQWHCKQVSKSLAILSVISPGYSFHLIDDAIRRLSTDDLSLIKLAKADYPNGIDLNLFFQRRNTR